MPDFFFRFRFTCLETIHGSFDRFTNLEAHLWQTLNCTKSVARFSYLSPKIFRRSAIQPQNLLLWGAIVISMIVMQCKDPWKAVPTAAVVSAASGVTDELIGVVKAAAEQTVEAAEQLLDK